MKKHAHFQDGNVRFVPTPFSPLLANIALHGLETTILGAFPKRNAPNIIREGIQLLYHADTPIKRHVQIQRERSPYDGDWVYWSNRRGNYPGTPRAVAALIKSQNGKCSYCGQYFAPDSLIEVHHKDKNRGNNKKENLALLHRHCHDIIHGAGNKVLKEGWLDEHPF